MRSRLQREISHRIEKLTYSHSASFNVADLSREPCLSQRFSFMDTSFVSSLQNREPRLAALVLRQAEASIEHRFDLLGSGPTVVAHGLRCRGVEGISYPAAAPVQADTSAEWLVGRINRSNLKESQRIWRMIGRGYIPIDWHLDFKSGFRWRENVWHRDIRFGQVPGADVKLPWELGRLQHLPTLALACHFAGAAAPGFREPALYEQEFRNQVLDFIATNPPGFGVNWACAMDVAIRCANLLVARDIVVASGARLDEAFEREFAASIVAHGRHVIKNLEWAPEYRGNHYLADVVGLLFAAMYLPGSVEVDSWLAFAAQEFMTEVAYQFHEDGSNFEASVCYHRLSAEMVLWACALLTNLTADKLSVLTQPQFHPMDRLPRLAPKSWPLHPVPGSDRTSPVPPWCWARLERMADFTQTMTRPDGMVTQFGDNDSGRFICLGSGEQLRAENDPAALAWSLDHGSLIAGIRALVGGTHPSRSADEPGIDILCSFAGLDKERPRPRAEHDLATPASRTIGDLRTWELAQRRFHETPDLSRWVSRFSTRAPHLLGGLHSAAFPGMGCYVFRSPRLYLAVRCGEIGLAGLGAHAHCDQLAIELVIDGETKTRDPGTFIYTAFPDKRNAYRSAKAHHVPRVPGREPANLALGAFDLRGAAEGECLYFGPRGFIGRHAGYGAWVYRIIELGAKEIVIRDFAEGGLSLIDPTPEYLPFSPAYGRTLP